MSDLLTLAYAVLAIVGAGLLTAILTWGLRGRRRRPARTSDKPRPRGRHPYDMW